MVFYRETTIRDIALIAYSIAPRHVRAGSNGNRARAIPNLPIGLQPGISTNSNVCCARWTGRWNILTEGAQRDLVAMSKTRTLNADQLGEVGESLFHSLCAQRGRVANKATRDRTGWDFRVEVPNTALDQNGYADKRQIPSSFVFQIKTMWVDRRRFSASLVAVERLARPPGCLFDGQNRCGLSKLFSCGLVLVDMHPNVRRPW